MEQNKLLSLKNLYAASPTEMPEELQGLFKRPLTQSEIESFTIVSRHSALQSMLADETNFLEDKGVYYIPKHKKILDLDDFYKFVKEKQKENENFIIIEDEDAWRTDIRAFVDSKPGKLKITFYVSYLKSGKFTPVATLCNEGDDIQNKDIKILREGIIAGKKIQKYGGTTSHYIYTHFDSTVPDSAKTTGDSTSDYLIFNTGEKKNTEEINAKYLQIANPDSKTDYDKLVTRIKINMTYNRSVRYELCSEEEALLPLYKRLGLKESGNSWSRRKGMNEDDIFPDVHLDKETEKRVTDFIINTLKENRGYIDKVYKTNGYGYKISEVQVKSVIVLSKPLPKHRRPVYHLFRGIKHGGGIEVVELVRGEISTIDMVPVTFYHLSSKKENTYVKTTYETMDDIRKEITNDAEIDRLTFADWSERKSQNPRLINAIMEVKDRSEKEQLLSDIKRFNRMSFGALFAEQLIKTGKVDLARSLADYIIERGDNMNYVCSSMQDILPGSALEETTIPKMLKMNKPCYDLLFGTNYPVKNVETLKTRYKAIKTLIPDGVLTKEGQKLFEQYMDLNDRNATKYSLYSGEKVDLLEMPEIIKPIKKMYDRIDNVFAYAYENRLRASRHYGEIVQAYITLKRFGYNLDELKVFIEFSLNQGSAEASLTELEQRERAANTAMEIYKNKIESEKRKLVEEKYAKRLKAVKRLETPMGERNYEYFWVLAPTQIYGEKTDYSIEREGAEMKHCVFRSYASRIAEGSYTVVFLRQKSNPTTPFVTIGINKEGRINQTYAEHDRPILEDQAQIIAKWARSKKGLVTFKSEGRDATPGGWPSSVPVPDLPAVTNEKWLRKLAGVSVYEEGEED